MNFILFICFALIHVSCPPKLRYQVEQTNTNGVWSELFSGACVCFGSFENGFSGHSSSSDHDLTQSIIEFVAPIISANFCEKAWFHIGMHSAIYYFFFSVFVPKRKNRATTTTGSQIELDFCSEKFGLDWHAFNGENKKTLNIEQSTINFFSIQSICTFDVTSFATDGTLSMEVWYGCMERFFLSQCPAFSH